MRLPALLLMLAILALAPCNSVAAPKCQPDAVRVGTVCMDRYEASVWAVPSAALSLLKKIEKGKATLRDLTEGGAVQHGCDETFFNHLPYPSGFAPDGLAAITLYAVSIPGIRPSSCLSAYQAELACRAVRKRLPFHDEWLRGALGTPDSDIDNGTTDCAVLSAAPALAGARSSCVSALGVHDMIGNVMEWTRDPLVSSNTLPLRGGAWAWGAPAAVEATYPSNVNDVATEGIGYGFRCVR